MVKKIGIKIWAVIIACLSLLYLTGIALPAFVSAADQTKGLIVIDPGHDQADPGAIAGGYEERYINTELSYKIAKELQNRGYEVWFSHSIFYDTDTPQDIPCVLPAKTGSKYDISTERVPAINQKDPDLAISIHHNAASSTTASGIEVYWRSDGTSSSIHQKSIDLGNIIYKHASSVDYINGRYGGVQDSMFLICKTNVPTVLFEGGYMTTPSELQNITNPTQQQKMANAIADAIEEYFTLYPSTHANMGVSYDSADAILFDENSSLVTVYASGVSSPYGVSSVQFPTFIPGVPDAIWYNGVYIGNDTWAYTYDASSCPGTYVTHIYATDKRNNQYALTATDSVTVSSSATNESNRVYTEISNKNQTEFLTIANNVTVNGGATGMDMAAFAPNSSDAVWSPAANTGQNTYVAAFDIDNLGSQAGTYRVDCYAHSQAVTDIGIGSATAVIPGPTAEDMFVSANLDGAGVFRIIVSGVSSPGNITDVKIPVWCADDQSDIVWYQAENLGNGNWAVNVNVSNHQNHTGSYKAHAYAYDDRGTSSVVDYINDIEVAPINTEKSVSIMPNYDQSVLVAVATGVPSDVTSVSFPTWTSEGDQDDIIWYNGKKISQNIWECEIPISDHNYETGEYNTHVYITQNNNQTCFGGTSFTVDPITAEAVQVTNVDNENGKFRVEVTGVTSPANVTRVQVPVCCASDQSDIVWYQADNLGNGKWVVDVDIANHQYHTGKYTIHVYATDSRNVTNGIGATYTNISFKGTTVQSNAEQSAFTLTATEVPANATEVCFAVWSQANGQDDLVWYGGQKQSSSTWTTSVLISEHNNETGQYCVDTYYKVGTENISFSQTTFYVDPISISGSEIVNMNDLSGSFSVDIKGVSSPATITQVLVPVWCASDQSDIVWYQANNLGNGTWRADVSITNHQNHTGTYQINAYAYDSRGTIYGIICTNATISDKMPIMGSAQNTEDPVNQMVRYFNNNNPGGYPDYYKTNGGAPNIETFCQIYYEEATAEGIRPEVAFAQCMKETGFLKFGGDVKIEQFNFAGLGATGGGNPGNSFPDVRTGARAHIQHLKAYASTDPLNQTCVDTRFNYVTRGTAPYVEWLAISANPYHVGWATDTNYGVSLANMVTKLLQS